jgi:hypothetical protein
MYVLYWGTHAYCTQQIILGAKHNMDFTIQLRELKLWSPQFYRGSLIVNPTVWKTKRSPRRSLCMQHKCLVMSVFSLKIVLTFAADGC